MFYYIKGIVTLKENNFLVLDVSGVGYKIYTSYTTLEKAEINKELLCYTYTHIREDMFDIYGFYSREELKTFELLITVSGVGPKAALSILSFMPTDVFAVSVIKNDVKAITQAPGIGKKIAERIILELKDKIANSSNISEEVIKNNELPDSAIKEAVDALMVLGYSNLEAKGAVKNVKDSYKDVEDIIKNALKLLMN
ncbi:MAG: Holliday junction branch migration protein RuvA [Clostridia bacterium]|nr:Holliday junction branch migration protein RuvA [Oscillospiraceae bacterium]MBR4892799.1 Holliday junction branch migration protein RuvA [Clostridia bacterium]